MSCRVVQAAVFQERGYLGVRCHAGGNGAVVRGYRSNVASWVLLGRRRLLRDASQEALEAAEDISVFGAARVELGKHHLQRVLRQSLQKLSSRGIEATVIKERGDRGVRSHARSCQTPVGHASGGPRGAVVPSANCLGHARLPGHDTAATPNRSKVHRNTLEKSLQSALHVAVLGSTGIELSDNHVQGLLRQTLQQLPGRGLKATALEEIGYGGILRHRVRRGPDGERRDDRMCSRAGSDIPRMSLL
mmetsp:Transcript_23464/g.61692  ORF Transcript_23464/g.61692 Transcript_23464/m.61692 type:complete len:247 (+) Transcript_23464:566-1306(+)